MRALRVGTVASALAECECCAKGAGGWSDAPLRSQLLPLTRQASGAVWGNASAMWAQAARSAHELGAPATAVASEPPARHSGLLGSVRQRLASVCGRSAKEAMGLRVRGWLPLPLSLFLKGPHRRRGHAPHRHRGAGAFETPGSGREQNQQHGFQKQTSSEAAARRFWRTRG